MTTFPVEGRKVNNSGCTPLFTGDMRNEVWSLVADEPAWGIKVPDKQPWSWYWTQPLNFWHLRHPNLVPFQLPSFALINSLLLLFLTFKTVTSRDLAHLLLFCIFSEILPALWCWGRGGGMTARKRERSANPVWRRKRSLLRCQYSKLIIFSSSFFSKTLVCLFTKTTKSLWQHLRFPFCARALRSACFTQGPRRAFLCAGGHVWEASWWTDRGQR